MESSIDGTISILGNSNADGDVSIREETGGQIDKAYPKSQEPQEPIPGDGTGSKVPPPLPAEKGESTTEMLDPPALLSGSNGGLAANSGPTAPNPKPLSKKELRRKNRRRLHRLLKNPEVLPSFLRVIEERKKVKKEPNTEQSASNDAPTNADDSDDDFLLEPPIVVIDVDKYLGLKKRKLPEAVLSAPLVGSSSAILPSAVGSTPTTSVPTRVPSSAAAVSSRGNIASVNPSDEGWFEGSHPMAMPDDIMYLTENQQSVRKNMEFFTASAHDAAAASNRRVPTVRGRIGFRCIHCAKAVRNGQIPKMPQMSVSFPKSFSALYSLAIQRQQMHLDACPQVPSHMKWAWNKGNGASKPRKRMKMGIPAIAYWQISCRRLGMVELENNGGLRFGRDPKLAPLPFESIRVEVQQEHPDLFPRQRQNAITPSAVLSTAAVGSMRTTASDAISTPIHTPKEVSDILEKAKREEDDPTTQLISKDDATALSDFMFLTIKQATLCYGMEEDFATRGKKTKLMRLGFAGFCCRHCKLHYYPANGSSNKLATAVFQNSCRSFSSSSTNVASAMSNSFVLHLMKCAYTPQNIKHAIQSLKRVHPKQMQQLPYGSQSSIFLKIWEKLRASDKPIQEAGIRRVVPSNGSRAKKKREDDDEYLPETIGSASSMVKTERVGTPKRSSSSKLPFSFPTADEKEVQEVLKDAEENWKPNQNDNLIVREDRQLISDFVFLCMRQLKSTLPNGTDSRLGRSRRMAGFCCMHCSGTQSASRTMSSGRSFPSAPDNIASILNATIYKHLMSCPEVPIKVKRTINTVRQLHTQQCASLPYGSQRRYFEKLFARLKNIPVLGVLANTINESTLQTASLFSRTLQNCSFVQTKNSGTAAYWQCSKCRMVPYDYRAPGSIFFSKPSVAALEKHRMMCQGDDIYWDPIRSSLKDLDTKYGGVLRLVNRESFVNVIRSVVGNEFQVIFTVMTKLGKNPEASSSSRGIWRQMPVDVDFHRVEECFSVLRKDLNLSQSSSLHDFPDFLDFLRLVSCYFQVPPRKFGNGDKREESSPSLSSSSPLPLSNSTPIVSGQQNEARPVIPLESNGMIHRGENRESISYDNSKDELHARKEIPAQDPSENSVVTRISGQVSGSNPPPPMPTRKDPPQPTVQVETAESATTSMPNASTGTGTNDPNPAMLMADQRLTWDQGKDVMENIESGQFDDA